MRKNPKILPGQSTNNGQRVDRQLSTGLVFKIILLVIVVTGGVYFLFYSSFFNISEVVVEGAQLVPSQDLNWYINDYINDKKNIWLLSSDDLKTNIENNFPLVEDTLVQKGIPNTIRVRVFEREPALIWISGDGKYLVDSYGYVFSDLEEYRQKKKILTDQLIKITDESAVPVENGQRLVSKSWVDFARTIDKEMIERFGLPISKYYITETAFDLYLVTDRGEIIVDTNRPLNEQLAALDTALNNIKQKNFSYLDLRINGWVYYK